MDMTAAEKIRVAAKRLNFTMGDLADATGQTRQNLSNKLGRDNLSEKEMAALAAAMGCKFEIRLVMPDGAEI